MNTRPLASAVANAHTVSQRPSSPTPHRRLRHRRCRNEVHLAIPRRFPWALGGYSGFAKVPNLAPTHRRFIAENAAYALLRIAPAFFIQNVEVLLLAVISYFIEGVTIAWEISCYKAPAGSMVPQTLMAVFASIVTYTVTNNAGGYIPNVDASLLTAMQGFCAATWGCWLVGALSTATAKEDGHRV